MAGSAGSTSNIALTSCNLSTTHQTSNADCNVLTVSSSSLYYVITSQKAAFSTTSSVSKAVTVVVYGLEMLALTSSLIQFTCLLISHRRLNIFNKLIHIVFSISNIKISLHDRNCFQFPVYRFLLDHINSQILTLHNFLTKICNKHITDVLCSEF